MSSSSARLTYTVTKAQWTLWLISAQKLNKRKTSLDWTPLNLFSSLYHCGLDPPPSSSLFSGVIAVLLSRTQKWSPKMLPSPLSPAPWVVMYFSLRARTLNIQYMNYPVSNEYPLHGYCGVAGGGRGIVSRSSTLNFFPAKQTVGREGEGWGNDGHCGLLLFTPCHGVGGFSSSFLGEVRSKNDSHSYILPSTISTTVTITKSYIFHYAYQMQSLVPA